MARIRSLFLAGSLLAAGANAALAQQGVDGVVLADPAPALQPQERTLELRAREDGAARFSPGHIPIGESPAPQRLELQIAASGEQAGLPIDISVAQRASMGANNAGDIDSTGRGSEVRIGRGLVQQDSNDSAGGSSVYMFVASDDEALVWRPGQRTDFGGPASGFSLQDRVEIGDAPLA